MERPAYTVAAYGDSALLVTFENRIDPLVNAAVHAAAQAVRAARAGGTPWLVPVPAYASLLARYDAQRWSAGDAAAELSRLLDTVRWPALDELAPAGGAVLDVPVRYGGDDGPDLAAVAERVGLSAAQVVELHCSVVYRAYMLGFAPGFAYLGELPAELELPRLDTPRPRVPAGSVAIAGRQTAVYPLTTPGGWHLLGRTDLPIWDIGRPRPSLIVPGQQVRFVPLA